MLYKFVDIAYTIDVLEASNYDTAIKLGCNYNSFLW